MQPIYERYRPSSLNDVVGQPKAVATLTRLLARPGGIAGRAFWISGASGTGKTTIARILAATVAEPLYTSEYSSADELTLGELAEIDRTMRLYGGGAKTGRAIIVNEAHGLRSASIRKLDGMLEPIPPHVVWIFTTTRDGQADLFQDDPTDAFPLLSRCFPLALTTQGLADAFAARALDIARAEELDGGAELGAVKRLVQSTKNNMRATLQAIEAGALASVAAPVAA